MKLVIFEFFKEKLGQKTPSIHHLDIGASGGIDTQLNFFSPFFQAVGIDPLVNEVENLNAKETDPNVNYIAAWLTWPEWEERYPKADRESLMIDSFPRTSTMHALKGDISQYIKDNYNNGEDVIYSDDKISMDDCVKFFDENRIDFVKTDTDGFDYPALRSGEGLLSSQDVLALKVEANFHGPTHPYANNFANIDIYLRNKGFVLLQLDCYNHSKGVFPAPFVYDIPAQTKTGQVRWGDAYYFKDFGNDDFAKRIGYEPTYDQILRLCFILEYLRHPDSAVELLINKQEQLDLDDAELTVLLDKMTIKYSDKLYGSTYGELIANFKADHRLFYPTK